MVFSFLNSDKVLVEVIIIYATVAFSIQVALRSGTFSLASIGFYGAGAYIAADLVKKQHQSAVVAIGAAVVAAGIVSWLLSRNLVPDSKTCTSAWQHRVRPDDRRRCPELAEGHGRRDRAFTASQSKCRWTGWSGFCWASSFLLGAA